VDWPDVVVVQESPLRSYSNVPDDLASMLTRYRRVQVFRAIDLGRPHVFDQQDALFVPYDGFKGVGRPGPNLTIYQRVE
jgi:hypothetical protein